MSLSVAVGPISIPGMQVLAFPPDSNPGFGGSEFHSIELACSLISAGNIVKLLVTSGSLQVPGLSTSTVEDCNWEEIDVIVTTSSALRLLPPEAKNIPMIAVSHHPHDPHIRALRKTKGLRALVNVGEYQTWSNRLKSIPSIWLPGFARGPQATTRSHSGQSEFVGHISSLHPSKGFHLVAKAWRKITQDRPTLKLRVLGGLSLYGVENLDNILPTTKEYAKQIMEIWGGRLPHSVNFLGKVNGDISAEIATWSFAILNPAGIGESDPVVMKDCLRAGVPVIGPRWFGMGDYMRHFPELQISRSCQIAEKAALLAGNPQLRLELSQRALDLTRNLENRTQKSFQLWSELVETVAKPNSESASFRGLPLRARKSSDVFSLLRGWLITESLWLSEKIQERSTIFKKLLAQVKNGRIL